MPIIECTGGETEQTVAGTTYHFRRDRYGRAVAAVNNHRHAAVFTAVEHYREVDDAPSMPIADDAAAEAPTPPRRRTRAKG